MAHFTSLDKVNTYSFDSSLNMLRRYFFISVIVIIIIIIIIICLDPDNKSVKRDMRFYGERTKAIPPQDRIGVIETSEIDIQKSHYEALCRGDVVRVNIRAIK